MNKDWLLYKFSRTISSCFMSGKVSEVIDYTTFLTQRKSSSPVFSLGRVCRIQRNCLCNFPSFPCYSNRRSFFSQITIFFKHTVNLELYTLYKIFRDCQSGFSVHTCIQLHIFVCDLRKEYRTPTLWACRNVAYIRRGKTCSQR